MKNLVVLIVLVISILSGCKVSDNYSKITDYQWEVFLENGDTAFGRAGSEAQANQHIEEFAKYSKSKVKKKKIKVVVIKTKTSKIN